ncbi:MAG: multicopper oxidase domain-containing protein [Nitrospiraceae bacterium]|nr:multicopper oxidase domain-containing protein [Nitrospiraceae bacterium]
MGILFAGNAYQVLADPLPGGTLDPLIIPKYVTHLVIPPVMKQTGSGASQIDDYAISVRQFKQQVLPSGFPATKVWGYGPESDPTPTLAPDPNSQFNYPSYTIETKADRRVNVRWINGLVDKKGNYLPHLLPVDQTLHWANPSQDCMHGSGTDCMGKNPERYRGPVPMVPHVHGAHVDQHSDGYSEAWWLPAAKNIPAGYALSGRLFDDATGTNPGTRGYADYSYRNDQPATTLWYHDHTLGMTRNNVYAGPAGFWLIRGGQYDGAVNAFNQQPAVLPGPAPVAGQGLLELNTPSNAVRKAIREIPLVIQDRSFNADGSLFYPGDRAFFEGLQKSQLQIKFLPDPSSDVPPIWNPETFYNTMVVNGATWPKLNVAQASYRFRLLNGSNARMVNLALFVVNPNTNEINRHREIPFYQIGSDQGFLPRVVRIKTGEQVALYPGAGEPAPNPNPNDPTALLMGLAERADVIVDFSGLPDGAVVRMINTAPDSPFGGFPADPSDPGTTGQVMQFVVKAALTGAKGSTDGKTTAPAKLKLHAEQPLAIPTATRLVSLNEDGGSKICVEVDADGVFVLDASGNLVQIDCGSANAGYFGPTAALAGTVVDAAGNPLRWTDTTGAGQDKNLKLMNGTTVTVNVTENPKLGEVEEWQIYNFTEDAHPVHLHLVRFEVISRKLLDGSPSPNGSRHPWERGRKDVVIAYPGEITTVRAKFDIDGLYMWHCHILEHEDNEMMRPMVVGAQSLAFNLMVMAMNDRHHHEKMMADHQKSHQK